MKKLTRISATVVAVLLIGCAGLTQKPDTTPRSPYDIAELSYAEGSLAYEFGMVTIRAALDEGLLSDALWTRAYQAQLLSQQYAPMVRAALDLWRSSGQKPESFDAIRAKLAGAWSEVSAVRSEVKQ